MMLNGRGRGSRMTVKELCQQMFENYLRDCGLDPMYWDCAEAAGLLLSWFAAHDFDIFRRFADLPVEVRSRIVSVTGLYSRWGERVSGPTSCCNVVPDVRVDDLGV